MLAKSVNWHINIFIVSITGFESTKSEFVWPIFGSDKVLSLNANFMF
jgi:hypothetical protein